MGFELLLWVHDLGADDEPHVLVLGRQKLVRVALGLLLGRVRVQSTERLERLRRGDVVVDELVRGHLFTS